MTVRIISGTITDAKDTFGVISRLFSIGAFIRWIWTEKGWIKEKLSIISRATNENKFSIIQTTGSGKTVLAVLYAYFAYVKGGRLGGNFSIFWTENNKGKEKSEWRPLINCIEDIENAKGMHITLDDIRNIIAQWNAKEAKLVSELANGSRKKGNWIDITTQRIENFIPPDIKFISDEIIVPIILILDKTQSSPDGRGKPLRIMALRFSPGYDLLDYKIYDLNNDTGEQILNGYDTLQLSSKLQVESSTSRTNQIGYELESDALSFLEKSDKKISWKHLDGKSVFDIISKDFSIDVCDMDDDGDLYTEHKNLLNHIRTANKKGSSPFLMFPYRSSWGFVPVSAKLAQRHKGDRIDTYRLPVWDVKRVLAFRKS